MAQDIYYSRKKKSGVVIVGKGMIAGALQEITGCDNDILFSSGVSNSGEKDDKNFQREIELVKFHLGKLPANGMFIYFSTISIFDPSKKNSPYILHKRKIEDIIRKSKVNHMILRLPNLVGFSSNPNTLTNYFADSIRLERAIRLSKNAVRHLIDVTDLSFIIQDLKNSFEYNKMTVNVETDKPLTARQILAMMEEAMLKKGNVIQSDEGSAFDLKNDSSDISTINYTWKTKEGYHKNLLRKYYSV